MNLSFKLIISGILFMTYSHTAVFAQNAKKKSGISTEIKNKALNVHGTYKNETQELTLFNDLSYLLKNGLTQSTGYYQFSPNKGSIRLPEVNTNFNFKRGELINSLDNNIVFVKIGKVMEENNGLKMSETHLVGKWELTTLFGKKIKMENSDNQPTIEFNSDGKFYGNNGCNIYNGSLNEVDKFRIVFGDAIQTMKACYEAMEIERQFMDVIRTADNYTINNGILSLNKARMAPLAVFKLVK
ncbi:MAG TPA: META domain-containing protein [Edaphocola sp.]|nr:META domain-containing protein [Edaphocola sp.]